MGRLIIPLLIGLTLFSQKTSAKYYVAIAAYKKGLHIRNGNDHLITPGHAYLVLMKQDLITKQTVIDQAWGFYSTSVTGGVISPIPGELKSEIGRYIRGDYDNLFTKEVSLAHYNSAIARILEWRKNEKLYSLRIQTCVDFIRYVIAVLPEIKLPKYEDWYQQFPEGFVSEIKVINHDPLDVDWNWQPINKILPQMKLRLKRWPYNPHGGYTDAWDYIEKEQRAGCKVIFSEIDFNLDKRKGLAVMITGRNCCNIKGECTLTIIENDGKKQLHFFTRNVHKIKPAYNGIIAENGRFFPLYDMQNN